MSFTYKISHSPRFKIGGTVVISNIANPTMRNQGPPLKFWAEPELPNDRNFSPEWLTD